MSAFVLVAAALIALAVVAYLFGMAVNKTDRERMRELREMLQQRAAGTLSAEAFEQRQAVFHASLTGEGWQSRNKWIFVIPPVMLAIVAAGIYVGANPPTPEASAPKAGSPIAAPAHPAMGATGNTGAAGPMTGATNAMTDRPGGDMEQMTKRLAERLKREPGDGPGWSLLARARLEMRQYREADEAFTQAAKILPPDAALLADWASAKVSANDGKWDKPALDLIARALAADAKDLKALSLAGKAAYAREDYAQATTYWQRMKAAATPGTMEAKEADAGIAEARARLSGGKAADSAPGKK